jgi:hypothetical protein
LGTARYASGQIAKTNPQAVNVQTPTATVAVRGTDFSMTVDELGRSLVMLLPSCDKKGCVTGAIEVSNEAGSVVMTQAYQATLVASVDRAPSSPVVVTIDQANINNMLIISRPREISEENRDNRRDSRNALDTNFLDQDFLKPADYQQNHIVNHPGSCTECSHKNQHLQKQVHFSLAETFMRSLLVEMLLEV